MNTETQSSQLEGDSRYQRVLRVLETLRERDLLVCLYSGLGRAFVFLLVSIVVRCLLDYWLHFAWSARVAFLVVDLAIVGWILKRYLVCPLRTRLDRDRAALRLQTFAPQLRSQVIATIQLVPQADVGEISCSLVERLLQQTESALNQIQWKQAVPLKSCVRWLLAVGMIGLGLVGWSLAQPNASSVLMARYFLSTRPPLFETQINVLSGDAVVVRGSRVDLLAELSGEIPQQVTFTLENATGASEEIRVNPLDYWPNRFSVSVENLQASFTYRVDGADARSRNYRVQAVGPPILRELYFEVTPPAYTGVPAYQVGVDQLRLEEGAKLSLLGEAAGKISTATAYFYRNEPAGATADKATGIQKNLLIDGLQVKGEFGILDSHISGMFVHMVGADGIESINDTRHSITWKLDKPPEIVIEAGPETGATVASGQPVIIEGQVLEDYGLRAVHLKWSRPDYDAPESMPLEIDNSGAFSFRFVTGKAQYRGDAIRLDLDSGDTVNWWIEAMDNSQLSRGPQLTKSPLRRFHIVTPEEKITELLNQVRNNLSTIKNASERQMEAGIRLRQLIEADNLQ